MLLCSAVPSSLSGIKFLHFQPWLNHVRVLCSSGMYWLTQETLPKKSEMFCEGVTLLGMLFVYCKVAGTKKTRLNKGPKSLVTKHVTNAADAHTLPAFGFFGRLGFDERSTLQWANSAVGITDVASLRFLYGFLWIPMDFYGFLWIPMDSKPWNWRKEWQKDVSKPVGTRVELLLHSILWGCNLRDFAA